MKRQWIQQRRERIADAILRLPPYRLPEPTTQLASIHMLSCRRDWLGALWSTRTFFANLGETLPVFVHDDGTLTRDIATRMQSFFPGLKVVSVPEANAVAERKLADFPRCLQARKRHAMLYKLLDVPNFALGEKYLLLDSDLLFFAYPTEIAQWLRGAERVNLWNRDIKNYLNITSEEARQRHGVKLVENVNAGMGCIWRESMEIQIIEEYFGYDSVWLPQPYNAEQTAFALLSSRFGMRFLPPSYLIDVRRETGLPPGLVMKHYVGKVRDLFFTEGIVYQLNHGFLSRPHGPATHA